MQVLDPKAECSLFLDDTCFKGKPEAVAVGKVEYQQALAAIGLQLNESKTQLWSPRGDIDINGIPPSIRQYVTYSLKAVGASVPYAKTDRLEEAVEDNTSPCPSRANSDDWRDTPLALHSKLQITSNSSTCKPSFLDA